MIAQSEVIYSTHSCNFTLINEGQFFFNPIQLQLKHEQDMLSVTL